MTDLTTWLDQAQARLPEGLAQADLSYRERDSLATIAALRAVLDLTATGYWDHATEDGDGTVWIEPVISVTELRSAIASALGLAP